MEILIAMIGICAIFAAVAVGMIWRGYVFSILWGWFAVPLFGLPALSVATAIGLSLLIGFATYQHIREPKDERSTSQQVGRIVGTSFLYPLFVLGLGWIVKQYL
jgi:hypothetical protein